MIRLLVPCLLISTLVIGGCVNRTPPTPPLTQAQLSTALSNTEMRLADDLAQICRKWEAQQALQNDQLQQIEKGQRQIDSKLILLEEKLDEQADLPPPPVAAAKPAECPPPAATAANNINNIGNKMVLGRVEWIWIEAVNRVFKTRVDTGATTSSFSAQNIVVFEKDGKKWVRFDLAPDDESPDRFEVEAPLVRYVRIRQSSGKSDALDRRPVVSLKVKVGKLVENAEFTLTDRTHMLYPILLGREYLKDIAVVDVAKTFIQTKPEVVSGLPQPAPKKDTDKK